MTLAELKRRYVDDEKPMPRSVRAELEADPRAGAQRILAAIETRRRQNRAEGQRLRKMLRYEREHWDRGIELVAGVDEAGMSPFAGPVVASAVILPVGCRIPRVDDSKKLSPEVRTELAAVIREKALAWAIGKASPEEIDTINIYHAGILAMKRAIAGLTPAPAAILVDGRPIPDPPHPQTALIKGDSRSLSIAAASILAKTTRDAEMVEMDAVYPGYGFAQHKGYPVAAHKAALLRLGATPIHRKSFAAVAAVLD